MSKAYTKDNMRLQAEAARNAERTSEPMSKADLNEQELVNALAAIINQSSACLNGVIMVPERALWRAKRVLQEYEGTEYQTRELKQALKRLWQ